MSSVHVVASAIRARCARSFPPGREERTSPKRAPAAVAYRFVAAMGLSVACGASDGGTERRGPARAAPTAIIAKDTKGFRSWAFSGALHAAAAKATRGGGRAFTGCATHVGCIAAAPPLPRCTDPGKIPAGLRHLPGTLEHHRAYRYTLAAEHVLQCNNAYFAGGMALASSGGLHRLAEGISCSGDRSAICCPFLPGTKVSVVGVVTDDPVPVIRDFWICQEEAPGEPPRSAAPPRPVVLEIGSHRPQYLRGFSHSGQHPAPPLGFWFGSRVSLWDPARAAVATVGSTDGPPLSCVALAPAGSRALTIDVTGTGVLWDVPVGRPLLQIRHLALPGFVGRIEPDASCTTFLVQQIEWRDDERQLLVVKATGRVLHVAETGGLLRQLETPDARDAWFGPDGAVFVSSHERYGVDVWDPRTLRWLARDLKSFAGHFPDGRIGVCPFEDGAGGRPPCRVLTPGSDAPSRVLRSACSMDPSPTGRFVSIRENCLTDTATQIVLRESDLRPIATVTSTRYADWAPGRDVLVLETARGIQVWPGEGAVRVAGKRARDGDHETRLLFSPDATAAATRHRIVRLKRGGEVRFRIPYNTGAWSPDGTMLAVWTLSQEGPSYDATASLELAVFDAGSGCMILDVKEPAQPPSPRQALVGAAAPRWIPGTDALELPVLGADSFARLVRPRTGESLWITMTERAGALVPVALAPDGRYDGGDTIPKDVLDRPGAPSLGAPPRVATGLLREFFWRPPRPPPTTCKRGRGS